MSRSRRPSRCRTPDEPEPIHGLGAIGSVTGRGPGGRMKQPGPLVVADGVGAQSDGLGQFADPQAPGRCGGLCHDTTVSLGVQSKVKPGGETLSPTGPVLVARHAVEGAASRHGAKPPPTLRPSPCFIYRDSIDSHRNSMEWWAMGKLTVRALRAVLVVVLAGTVFVQALMVWALATDPEDGSLPLTPLRVITILGMVSVQVALVCVWRLVTMVRRGTVFSHAAFRYVDVVIGAIVAAALVWFAVTVLNAPGQRDDPGVTVIMGGVGVAILGVALIVLVLRMLLAQAVRATSKRRRCRPSWTR